MNEMGLGERRLLGLFALTTEKAVEEGNEQFLLDAKAVSVALPIDPRIPSVSAFIDAFKEEYGKNPRAEAAYAYDSVYILKTALELCDLKDRLDDPDCIAEELLNIKDFSGGAGPAKMDDDGDTIRDMALMEYTSQGWKFLY